MDSFPLHAPQTCHSALWLALMTLYMLFVYNHIVLAMTSLQSSDQFLYVGVPKQAGKRMLYKLTLIKSRIKKS